MQILLPEQIEKKLVKALNKAGNREIGGILMGEHVTDAMYRIREITIQSHGGSLASFLRMVRGILEPLKRFFRETEYNYSQFNYLGEWHSHPSYTLRQSDIDCHTMWEIVEDPKVGANFVVLLIVRVRNIDKFDGAITVFLPGGQIFEGELVREGMDA